MGAWRRPPWFPLVWAPNASPQRSPCPRCLFYPVSRLWPAMNVPPLLRKLPLAQAPWVLRDVTKGVLVQRRGYDVDQPHPPPPLLFSHRIPTIASEAKWLTMRFSVESSYSGVFGVSGSLSLRSSGRRWNLNPQKYSPRQQWFVGRLQRGVSEMSSPRLIPRVLQTAPSFSFLSPCFQIE